MKTNEEVLKLVGGLKKLKMNIHMQIKLWMYALGLAYQRFIKSWWFLN